MKEEKPNLEDLQEVKAQTATFYNYNKSGQPGIDLVNVVVESDHKNWGLLRCVSPTNNYP